MTLETQYKNFLKDNPDSKLTFEEWEKINSRLVRQAIINIMEEAEKLGVYGEDKK